jgi:hypothetical protein
MENTCFMLQELSKLSKQERAHSKQSINYLGDDFPLDAAIKEVRIVFTRSFKTYCTEQFNYMFRNMIQEEGKAKSGEEIKRIYEKFFLKKVYAHNSHTRMMQRVHKHLQKEDMGVNTTLKSKCHEKLIAVMEERIKAVLPDKDLDGWPKLDAKNDK